MIRPYSQYFSGLYGIQLLLIFRGLIPQCFHLFKDVSAVLPFTKISLSTSENKIDSTSGIIGNKCFCLVPVTVMGTKSRRSSIVQTTGHNYPGRFTFSCSQICQSKQWLTFRIYSDSMIACFMSGCQSSTGST